MSNAKEAFLVQIIIWLLLLIIIVYFMNHIEFIDSAPLALLVR